MAQRVGFKSPTLTCSNHNREAMVSLLLLSGAAGKFTKYSLSESLVF